MRLYVNPSSTCFFLILATFQTAPPCTQLIPTAAALALDFPPPGFQAKVFVQPRSPVAAVPEPPSCYLKEGILSFMLMATSNESKPRGPSSSSGLWKEDKVIRVLDANTVKLDKTGLVSLAAVKTPQPGNSAFEFSECLSRSPSYKLKQLLTKDAKVRVQTAVSGGSSGTSNPPQAVLVRANDGLVVNEELVRAGYARLRNRNLLPSVLSTDELVDMENHARQDGLGLFKRCEGNDDGGASFEAQFEPLDLTTETQWGADGGKTVLRSRETAALSPPSDPGDKVGCSDFMYYEDALKYYEKFFPFYGDVAKLDRDGDGVPCPRLPHTPVAERYRMKIPKTSMSQ